MTSTTSKPPDDSGLRDLAARASAGNQIARNTLWEKMQPLVVDAVKRQWSLPRLWDRDDLWQEAFLVFAKVCDNWEGSDPTLYFETEYPRQLRLHVRRAFRKQAREISTPHSFDLASTPDAEGPYRSAELLEALSKLPVHVQLALKLHLLWGMPLAQINHQLGLGRRATNHLISRARRAIEEKAHPVCIERLVREMFRFTDSSGRLRASSREIKSQLGLTPREYRELLDTLSRTGVLRGRAPGHAGRLPQDGPEIAIQMLRKHRKAP